MVPSLLPGNSLDSLSGLGMSGQSFSSEVVAGPESPILSEFHYFPLTSSSLWHSSSQQTQNSYSCWGCVNPLARAWKEGNSVWWVSFAFIVWQKKNRYVHRKKKKHFLGPSLRAEFVIKFYTRRILGQYNIWCPGTGKNMGSHLLTI